MYLKKYYLAILLTSILMMSCDSTRQPKDLFEEQRSGVCLVLNSYYYTITLPNGNLMYCTGIDDDGIVKGLTMEYDEVIKNKAKAYGTAFFIDDKGMLMTNRHVVSPAVSETDIKNASIDFMGALKELIQYYQLQYFDQILAIENQMDRYCYIDYLGNKRILDRYYYDYWNLSQKKEQLASEFADMQDVVNNINRMDLRNIKVQSINEIGVAFNDTFVNNESDFLKNSPCVIVKTSDDEDIDLALIQLKSQQTPSDKYIFKIKGTASEPEPTILETITSWFGRKHNDTIDVYTELIMMGFNGGPALGNTRQGIQAQMTCGRVSQKPDGSRLLYTIPSLQGSSGSPVIDLYGVVRAVNYAKVGNTQSFNFGIPENKINEFLNK